MLIPPGPPEDEEEADLPTSPNTISVNSNTNSVNSVSSLFGPSDGTKNEGTDGEVIYKARFNYEAKKKKSTLFQKG